MARMGTEDWADNPDGGRLACVPPEPSGAAHAQPPRPSPPVLQHRGHWLGISARDQELRALLGDFKERRWRAAAQTWQEAESMPVGGNEELWEKRAGL